MNSMYVPNFELYLLQFIQFPFLFISLTLWKTSEKKSEISNNEDILLRNGTQTSESVDINDIETLDENHPIKEEDVEWMYQLASENGHKSICEYFNSLSDFWRMPSSKRQAKNKWMLNTGVIKD